MQGRIWGYVCDQRPWAGTAPPGVVYRYAPNWKAEHVLAHLGSASGILPHRGPALKFVHQAECGYPNLLLLPHVDDDRPYA